MKQLATDLNEQKLKRRLLAPREVEHIVGLSRVTLWRMCRRGDFPKPVQISAGRVGFFVEDLEAWIASKRKLTTKPQPRGGTHE